MSDDLVKDQESSEQLPDFEIKEVEKRPIDDILKDAETINLEQVAGEVLGWAIVNVENFIDNKNTIFKLDLMLNSETMRETQRLQDLYQAIPDDEDFYDIDKIEEINDAENAEIDSDAVNKIVECRQKLDEITKSVFQTMVDAEEAVEKLYERMIYYYEMVGIKQGVPVIRNLDGKLHVRKFEYEAFKVPVKIVKKNPETNEEETKEYEIPEGFTLWLEIEFFHKKQQTSLF